MSLNDLELWKAHEQAKDHDHEIVAREQNDRQEIKDQDRYAGWMGLEHLKEAP